MNKDEVLLLISIMSLLGSAYVMKKFAPLLKAEKQNADTTHQEGNIPKESVLKK